MKYLETAIEMLEDTEISSELKAIYDFYNSIQPELDGFRDEFGLTCPDECGECCAHFIPDITKSEALLLGARVLFGERKSFLQDRLQETSTEAIVCPFYDARSKYHCMIYSARPLVCRLFYSCATTDKTGKLKFCKCHFNAASKKLSDDKLVSSQKTIRSVGEYGAMLDSLDGNSPETELLPFAVLKAISRIGYALNLLFSEVGSVAAENPEA